ASIRDTSGSRVRYGEPDRRMTGKPSSDSGRNSAITPVPIRRTPDTADCATFGMPTTVRQAMSVRDEGRPLGAGLRWQPPNHRERLGSRALVVSVPAKGTA